MRESASGPSDSSGLAGSNYIPFGQPSFSDGEVAAVERVLRSGWVGRGPEVAAFEHELAEHVGAERVLTVNSCSAALFLSLLVSGVGAGDEVLCPSLNWYGDANVILQLGAIPVFCDVDADTLSVTPETISRQLSPRSKAVVLVHFGGLACEPGPIRERLPGSVAIIEDAAHAFGARYADGTRVGASGNPTCFSFYANKNLSTGDGGALALADRALADRVAWLRQQGVREDAFERYRSGVGSGGAALIEAGYKMGYTDLSASIGRVQLRRQTAFDERRLAIASIYVERLGGMYPLLRFQHDVLSPQHARHLLAVRVTVGDGAAGRDRLIRRLRERNVGAVIHYPPLHRESAYGSGGRLPVTEEICDQLLTLPISAVMTDDEAGYCADRFAEVLEGSDVTSPEPLDA